MKFWPGSHLRKQFAHRDTFDEDNLLTRGQEIAVDVPADEGVDVALKAGEMSLHHVVLAHGSGPHTTHEPRIRHALPYIPPPGRPPQGRDSAHPGGRRGRPGHLRSQTAPH